MGRPRKMIPPDGSISDSIIDYLALNAPKHIVDVDNTVHNATKIRELWERLPRDPEDKSNSTKSQLNFLGIKESQYNEFFECLLRYQWAELMLKTKSIYEMMKLAEVRTTSRNSQTLE